MNAQVGRFSIASRSQMTAISSDYQPQSGRTLAAIRREKQHSIADLLHLPTVFSSQRSNVKYVHRQSVKYAPRRAWRTTSSSAVSSSQKPHPQAPRSVPCAHSLQVLMHDRLSIRERVHPLTLPRRRSSSPKPPTTSARLQPRPSHSPNPCKIANLC